MSVDGHDIDYLAATGLKFNPQYSCTFCGKPTSMNETHVCLFRPAPIETIVEDPDTGGKKGTKPARFDLLPPEVLFTLAEHYAKGAEKYDDHNWRKGYKWSLSFAAMQRHLWAFWNGEDLDPETGMPHLAAAMFHCAALLFFMQHHPDKDDRWHADTT